MNAIRLTSVALCLALWAPIASAEEVVDSPSQTEATDKKKRPLLFPAFRKRDKEAEAVAAPPADEPAVAPEDVPATELPSEGIWEWVDRMDGEIPTEEQLDAIEEQHELEVDELVRTDELSGGEVPLSYYAAPAEHLEVDPLFLDLVDPSEFDIPVEVNPEVAKWVAYFTGPGRKYYSRWLSRSTRYRPMMYRELEKAGLPRDLVYLSMIESGYNAHAYSHAAAAGLWQFIPSTGKLYKLRIDWWVDERRDPEASVGAAIAFLGELHQMFGDWRLAWGAYNGGPGRIRRATRSANSNDFWTLARGPYLHSETDNYVPKIMAAAIIGHHPERYGFTDIDYQDELVYETARVDGSVELAVLARCAGTTVDELKALNPALRRYATPPEGYDVRLPVGKKETFAAAFSKVPKSEWITVVRHTVRKGETLGKIAARYGTSVSDLSRANNLRNANRIYVGMSLTVPKGGSSAEAVASVASSSRSDASSSSRSSSSGSSSSRPSTHTVQRGESLSTIASKYGTTVTALRSANGLSSSKILVGQKLKLSGTASSGSSSSSTSTHVVRKGESLGSIASRYGVSVSSLQKANGIRDASHIVVGQKLKIVGGSGSSSSGWTTYTVQRGDSLGKIATRYGVSVSSLQSWNGIRGSVIQPGQTLKIRRS
jgi:membrane-bound lytic murein transglycosylase D